VSSERKGWGPQRLGGEVDAELGRHGAVVETARMIAAWQEVVGQAIAQNAWPARVGRDGTLHVHTADSVWAFELGQRAPEIASRLGVPAVRFAPGPIPEGGPEDAADAPARAVEPGEWERAAGAEIAAPIEDGELRELVARAAAASLAKAAADRRF
jgi:hypothetical protein